MAQQRRLVIDGDLYLYRATTAVERPIQWDDDLWTLHSSLEEAVEIFTGKVEEICSHFDAKRRDLTFVFSSQTNWRKRENPEYKANRVGVRKPVAFRGLKHWCEMNLQCLTIAGLEADDVLGLIGTRDPAAVVVSDDKDMQGIPATVLNPAKDWFPRLITKEEADRWHWMQTLMGDKTDGYGGCPGIGPVKAAKILDATPPEERWEKIVECFENVGLTRADALMNARMARIVRNGEWDYEKGIMTWQPS
jgi:DNA polymerase-1